MGMERRRIMEGNEKIQEYAESLVKKARAAQAVYAKADQKMLNRVARAAARCIYDNAELFAKEAVDETGMGTVEGKILKQKSAMTSQWCYTKDKISTGVVGWEQGKLDVDCILKIAKPIGVVGAVMPVTNPTTCFGGNAMYVLKTGNAMIVCPHPRAKMVSLHCTELMREAITAAGAPADLIQCVEEPSIEMSAAVMAAVDVVVATGGPGIVKAANSSGNPSLGVGQGNCQVIIDKGMNSYFDSLAKGAVSNRAWDSGIPCNGEQTIIMPACDSAEIIASFERHGAMHVENAEIRDRIRELIFEEKNGSYRANPAWVGQPVQKIGAAAGLEVPEDKQTLLLKLDAYGPDERLCREKMCPISGYYVYEGDWREAVHIGKTNLLMEGAGHSSDIYTESEENQTYAGIELPVCRLVVNNNNAVLGGEPYYTNGMIATTGIGCGFYQKNILSENLNYTHLLNYTRLYYTVEGKPTPTEDEIWEEI